MSNKIINKIAGALVSASALSDIALAQDDIVKEQSDLEAAIEQVPTVESERSGGPITFLTRAYSDNSDVKGKNEHYQVIVSNGFGKLAFRDEGDSRVVGADLKLGEFYDGLDGFRFNAGSQEIKSSGDVSSRALIERSYKDSKWFDFWNLEVQDLAKPSDNRIAGAVGLKYDINDEMNLKPQVTLDSEGNFGYALIWNTDDNSGIGVGGKRINDLDTFNFSVHKKWTDGFLDGYKVWTHGKVFETGTNSPNGLEARVRFGEKAPGGAFIAGVQDTLFNSITGFLGGDGDATFPFGIGSDPSRIDFFGAAASNGGKLGSFSFDVKYSDPGISDRSLKTDIALGLGSVSDSFLKNNVLQVGRTSYLDSRSSNSDVLSADYRTTLWSNSDNSLSFDFGLRYAKPEDNKAVIGGALALTYKF